MNLEQMVTESRAAVVARKLFPWEYADGSDCRNENGRPGQPCLICASHNDAWKNRVAEVRAAMVEAFKGV